MSVHSDIWFRQTLFLLVNLLRITPLHAQIEQELRRMLSLPEFQNGAILPTEMILATQFGVSRGTVRAALMRLVDRGLLQRKPGVGTRAVHIPSESSIGAWRSFSQEMARRNIKVECYSLQMRSLAAPESIALALQIATGTKILRLDRVRGWGGQPVLHSRSWFHPRIKLPATADFSRPLYDVIQETTGAVAECAREEFSAVRAKPAMALQLRLTPRQTLLLRCHTVFDTGNRPMEYAEIHYDSKRFTLTLDLKAHL